MHFRVDVQHMVSHAQWSLCDGHIIDPPSRAASSPDITRFLFFTTVVLPIYVRSRLCTMPFYCCRQPNGISSIFEDHFTFGSLSSTSAKSNSLSFQTPFTDPSCQVRNYNLLHEKLIHILFFHFPLSSKSSVRIRLFSQPR